MSKRDNRRVVLRDYMDKKRSEGSIEIQTDDGQVFVVDPPELWPDLPTEGTTNADIGKLILGEERFAAFIAAGGSANILMGVIQDHNGASMGESSASSPS